MKKRKNKLLKKIVRRLKTLTAWLPSKRKETVSQERSPSSQPSLKKSKANSNGRSSVLPLMSTGNTSLPESRDKNNMGILSPFGGNLPPEVAAEVDKIVSKMVRKVEPEMQEIVILLKKHGIPGTSIELQMGALDPEKVFGFPMRVDPSMMPGAFRFERPTAPAPAPAPANDLVEGIYQILGKFYENDTANFLGMIYDKNRIVSVEIAKIMEAARKRDQESVARELEGLATKVRSK